MTLHYTTTRAKMQQFFEEKRAPAGAGGALRRGGGACGRRGRFFKETAPQKPVWEKVFGVPHGVSANMAVPAPEGARPVFADGKDRSSRGLSLRGPFFFGWGYVVVGRKFFKF